MTRSFRMDLFTGSLEADIFGLMFVSYLNI